MDTVGARIKEARLAKNMTQAELAEQLGVTYQNIGQWENGKRTPRLETLEKIAEALGISMEWFIYQDLPVSLETAQERARKSFSQNHAVESFSYFLEQIYGKATEHTVEGEYHDEEYNVYANYGAPFSLTDADIGIIYKAVYAVMDALVDRLKLTEQEAEIKCKSMLKFYETIIDLENLQEHKSDVPESTIATPSEGKDPAQE